MADLATIEKSAVKLAQDTSDWINKNIRDNKNKRAKIRRAVKDDD